MDPVLEQLVVDFDVTAGTLKDWPDKYIIMDLTNGAKKHVNLAPQFSGMLVARLLNESTNAAYKLPLFYLIDSIMKHVGGPYPALFGKHFAETYSLIIRDLHSKDIDRLDFLLNTWEERKLLPLDLINKMKYQLNRAKQQTQQPFFQQHPKVNLAPTLNIAPNLHQPIPTTPESADAAFNELVYSEMLLILDQLYNELNVTERLSVEDLSVANPQLFAQIREKAEESAATALIQQQQEEEELQEQQKKLLLEAQKAQLQQLPTEIVGRKRATMQDFEIGNVVRTTTQPQPMGQQRRNVAPRFHQGDNQNTARVTGERYRSSSQDSRESVSKGRSTGQRPGRGGAGRGQNRTQQYSSFNSSGATGAGVIEPPPTLDHFPMESNDDSRFFVNGYISENPVVVDVDHARRLQAKMLAYAAQLTTEAGSVEDVAFGEAAAQVARRLGLYLTDVLVPPPLPQILFGSLPLKPINIVVAPAKIVNRIPTPEFKAELLGRSPDAALQALYGALPHQFHEDGLRFSSLALLQKHTDAFLEKKKLRQKRLESPDISARESREWFCTINQWVSNFNSLSNPSNPTTTDEQGNPVVGDMDVDQQQVGEDEEFIVPADENFTRCPVSREMFECVWDDEEGEMMYRNAVKVFVTEAADPHLFKLSKKMNVGEDEIEESTGEGKEDIKEGSMEISNGGVKEESKEVSVKKEIGYLIVHKLLVMDGWLAAGKATSLSEAINRKDLFLFFMFFMFCFICHGQLLKLLIIFLLVQT